MSQIACPLCGAPVTVRAVFGQGKPFCTHCGWNLARAENSFKDSSRVLLFIPVLIIVIGMAFLWFPARAGHNVNLVAFLPIFFLLALGGVFPLWRYTSTKRAIALAKASPSLQGMQTQPIPDAFLQRIQSLPRPRRVGFRFVGAFAGIAVVAVALLGAVAIFGLTSRAGTPLNWKDLAPMLPVLLIIPVFGAFLIPSLLKEKRNRPLFQDGEVAAARVLAQRVVAQGKTSYSQIDYEFRASDGQTIRNSERDLTRKVFEDMLIPVFYDPVNPSRCAALCASCSRLPDAEP